MKRIELVDFLKGYSIFTIMISHYLSALQFQNPYEKIIHFGGAGVHLFIILSGFGLYYSFINKPLTYSMFLKRRISKIYVPYILVVVISAVISVFIPVYKNSLYALGGHVFLYKMFDGSIMESYGGQLWFISMILQFYLTFYIIIWLKSKLKNKLFLISGLLISISWSILVFLINKESEVIWNSFFLQFYWEFAIGIVIGEKISKNQKLIGKNYNQLLLLVIGLLNCALYGLLALKGDVGKLFNDFFASTGYSLLAVFLYNLKIKPANQIFLFIGKISFPVFLIHVVVIETVAKLFTNLYAVYIVILAIMITIPLSILYQKAINVFFKIIKL